MPPVGTWIEIVVTAADVLLWTSCPPWARGLKYATEDISYCAHVSCPPWARGLKLTADTIIYSYIVVPPVGTWIEIILPHIQLGCLHVVPPVGTWIEMLSRSTKFVL